MLQHWASEGEFYIGGFLLHNFIEPAMFVCDQSNVHSNTCVYVNIYIYTLYTVFQRRVRAGSINFTVCVMCGQFEGALYSRARFNSTNHAAKPRHIVKLDRKILMQEVLV